MFKVFISIDEEDKFHGSMGLNGNDLFNILPMEVQDQIIKLMEEDEEIKEYFNQKSIIYLVADEVKDITDLEDDKVKKELDKVVERNFCD